MTAPYRVEVYDQQNRRTGVLSRFESMDVVARYCDVGTFIIAVPTPYIGDISAGSSLAFFQTDSTTPFLSGPVTGITQDWSDANPAGLTTFNGLSDECWIADRTAYPDPTQPANNQIATSNDTQTGVAETIMYSYARRNAGPSALTARQVTGLFMYPDQARGSSVTFAPRFDDLDVLLTRIGVNSTPKLGWRVYRQAGGLTFQVFQPSDKTGVAHFSKRFGNLRAYTFSLTAAASTRALVAGSGVGTARTIREVTTAGSLAAESTWQRRIEMFVDQRQTNDATQLTQAGVDQLTQDAATTGASITPVDLPLLKFGVDYFLGDTVLVEIDGVSVADVVREVHLTFDAQQGPRLSPTIGNESFAFGFAQFYKKIRGVQRRVAYIEKSQ